MKDYYIWTGSVARVNSQGCLEYFCRNSSPAFTFKNQLFHLNLFPKTRQLLLTKLAPHPASEAGIWRNSLIFIKQVLKATVDIWGENANARPVSQSH